MSSQGKAVEVTNKTLELMVLTVRCRGENLDDECMLEVLSEDVNLKLGMLAWVFVKHVIVLSGQS